MQIRKIINEYEKLKKIYICRKITNFVMNINDINKDLNKMKVDKSTKEALISLIDQKITNDMEKILQEMRSLETRFTTQMEADRKTFAERTTTLTVVISIVGIVLTIIGLFLLFKK